MRNRVYEIGLWEALRGTFVIPDGCGRVRSTVGFATLGHVDLSRLRGQSARATGFKAGSGVLPRLCFSSGPDPLSDALGRGRVSQTNSFPFKLLLVCVLPLPQANEPIRRVVTMLFIVRL